MRFLDWLFGCSHKRTTFPLTHARKVGFQNSSKGTYITCLDCGKEFTYDWKNMRIIDSNCSTLGSVEDLMNAKR